MSGLIVDNFAGGGGASTGIEAALGRAVDIAINHDEQAIRMHEVNHPGTRHIRNNIWQIDPLDVTGGTVSLAWFSPDCKHFSKAKGGKPREKSIRDLAWIVVLWAKRVKPDVILLENVEEFRTWGPLDPDGRPMTIEVSPKQLALEGWDAGPEQKRVRLGETFAKWCDALRKAGYRLQFRELRACDYGAPTIRKRFFMIARRDGKPIVWPEPTHGKPDSPGVLSGKLQPWRTAAEIIDWSIPCPSIFERKKPLADKTLRRIAHGIMKFVVDNPQPFIVGTSFTNTRAARVFDLNEPLRTQTAQAEYAVVSPVIVGCGGRRGQSGPVGPEQPYPTTTAKADACLVEAAIAPLVSYAQQGGANRSAEDPLHTVTASLKDHNTVVAAFMQKFAQNGKGSVPADPLHTVMAGAPRHAVVCAHIEQANGGPNNENLAGRAADDPLSTIQTKGSQQRLVTSNLVKLRGTCRDGQPVDEPLHTVSAGGTHMAEVRAFLLKYYSSAQHGQEMIEPLHTLTHQARFGLVTVTIEGEEYVIVDIGMRMLTPRELFNAQGFPPDYIIDRDSEGLPITKTAQVAKCGNSVCPPIAEALVRAQFPESAVVVPEVEAA